MRRRAARLEPRARPGRRTTATAGSALRRPAALLALVLAATAGGRLAGAGAPTDIVRVDDFIGAPRSLFGRSAAQVERSLGPPLEVRVSAVPSYRDATVFHAVRRLSYPGLLVDVLDSGRVRRVRLEAAGRGLPFGLDVGSPRAAVEQALGEPQQARPGHLMYLYSDGFPDTVHFHLRDGRVHAIEWNYGSAE